MKIPNVILNNGAVMPVVGLGTSARKEVEAGAYRYAVISGLDLGYQHIDTASVGGLSWASAYNNEIEVGEGINDKIEHSDITREQLFVTTKLWNDRHRADQVVPSLRESLNRLQLDYIDLYLMHWPFSIDEKGQDFFIDYLETWRGMEEAVSLGLAKSIGVSNFNEHQLLRLLGSANIKPVVNQFEINPTFTQERLVEVSKKNLVAPVAYTPLGLISEARPEFIGKDLIKTDLKLAAIAEKYGKSRAQIALKYLIQRGIAVIPKSFIKSRMAENIDLFDFTLTASEMSNIFDFNVEHKRLF